MINIQRYSGRHVKDGKTVRGYAAIGYGCDKAFIMVPAKETKSDFHIVEVEPESLVPIL